MFNINIWKKELFVCKNLTYLQSFIYFRTELLTLAKSIRHVSTGFLWSHRWWKVVPSQNFLNIIIRNPEIVQVFEDSQILLASSSGFLGVSWLRNLWFDSWLDDFSSISISSLRFREEIVEIQKKCNIWICGLQNFEKFELKISSIRMIRIIRKNSLIRIIWIFGQRINRSQCSLGKSIFTGPRSIEGVLFIWSGASGLPYYCAPLVCVSEVIKSLVVWWHYKPKTKNLGPRTPEIGCSRGSAFEPGASGLPYYCTPPVCVPTVLGALAVRRPKKKSRGTPLLRETWLLCTSIASRASDLYVWWYW